MEASSGHTVSLEGLAGLHMELEQTAQGRFSDGARRLHSLMSQSNEPSRNLGLCPGFVNIRSGTGCSVPETKQAVQPFVPEMTGKCSASSRISREDAWCAQAM